MKHITYYLLACFVIGIAGCESVSSTHKISNEVHERNAIPSGGKFSSALKRATERNYDQFAEWFCCFRKHDLKGDFQYEECVIRSDPTDVIMVGDTYYVWYTKGEEEAYGFGTGDPSKKVFPWDLTEVWYATSKDGWDWKEQGLAVGRGLDGAHDDRAVRTPEVLAHDGKYYLVYQVAPCVNRVKNKVGTYKVAPYADRVKSNVGMAIADSPDGPWRKLDVPILKPADNGQPLGDEDNGFKVKEQGDLDSHKVHDLTLMYYNNKFYLYYQGEGLGDLIGMGGRESKWGVAIADKPEGPYVKSPHNPITNSGNELCVWPYRGGIAAMLTLGGSERSTVQFAEDGINFEIKSQHIQWGPHAVGLVRSLDTDKAPLEAMRWGLCHEYKGSWQYIRRFESYMPRAL